MAALMMPKTGSTLHFLLAYTVLPAIVLNQRFISVPGFAGAVKGSGSMKLSWGGALCRWRSAEI